MKEKELKINPMDSFLFKSFCEGSISESALISTFSHMHLDNRPGSYGTHKS